MNYFVGRGWYSLFPQIKMQRKFNGQNNSRVTNKQTNKHRNTDDTSYNYTNQLRPKASRLSQFNSVPSLCTSVPTDV